MSINTNVFSSTKGFCCVLKHFYSQQIVQLEFTATLNNKDQSDFPLGTICHQTRGWSDRRRQTGRDQASLQDLEGDHASLRQLEGDHASLHQLEGDHASLQDLLGDHVILQDLEGYHASLQDP